MRDKPSFIEDEKFEDSLQELSVLAGLQLNLESSIKNLEDKLKELKKAYSKLSNEDIPNLLISRGLSRVKLSTGESVEVTEDLSVTVKDDYKFFEFLRERKEDDIIKTMFSFDRMPTDKLDKLLEFLYDKEYKFEFETNVHHNTRKKYFKVLTGMEEGDERRKLEGFESGKYIRTSDLPEWCSVFVIYKTRIK